MPLQPGQRRAIGRISRGRGGGENKKICVLLLVKTYQKAGTAGGFVNQKDY